MTKPYENIRDWICKIWKSMGATMRATLISSLISSVVAIIFGISSCNKSNNANKIASNANKIASNANKIASETRDLTTKEFMAKYTPDLRMFITPGNIYVGSGKDFKRDGDIIIIPLTICNKSYGLAKDVEVTVLYNDGTEVDRQAKFQIPVLKGGIIFKTIDFAPSILNNAYDKYNKDEKKFKMKIFINWKDAAGKGYNSVEKFELVKTQAYSDSPSKLVFQSSGFYNDITNPSDYEKKSIEKIDF